MAGTGQKNYGQSGGGMLERALDPAADNRALEDIALHWGTGRFRMQALRTVRIGGFKKLKWKKKEEEGLAFCSGVQADEIKRLGGLW